MPNSSSYVSPVPGMAVFQNRPSDIYGEQMVTFKTQDGDTVEISQGAYTLLAENSEVPEEG